MFNNKRIQILEQRLKNLIELLGFYQGNENNKKDCEIYTYYDCVSIFDWSHKQTDAEIEYLKRKQPITRKEFLEFQEMLYNYLEIKEEKMKESKKLTKLIK